MNQFEADRKYETKTKVGFLVLLIFLTSLLFKWKIDQTSERMKAAERRLDAIEQIIQ